MKHSAKTVNTKFTAVATVEVLMVACMLWIHDKGLRHEGICELSSIFDVQAARLDGRMQLDSLVMFSLRTSWRI